jgi:esterase/lipase superfamily enzyme
MKTNARWYSPRMQQEMHVVRWGKAGVPVLLFPSAGGDAEELERFGLLKSLQPLIDFGKIRLYSVDGVAGRALSDPALRPASKAKTQAQFVGFLRHELIPAIRTDCRDPEVEIIVAGASIGAYYALLALGTMPDLVKTAVCLSGTYDLTKFLGDYHGGDVHQVSPLHFLTYLPTGLQLDKLRSRFLILACGEGRWETPADSFTAAGVLAKKAIPHRVDLWGKQWDHDWVTWRAMLPKYLDELTQPKN